MKKDKKIIYENQVDFNKKLRGLKKYCPQGYKDWIFNKTDAFETKNGCHKIKLKTSREFKFIYGEIEVIYEVNNDEIILKDIEPASFFLEGHKRLLNIYNGMPFRNKQDIFKINLMNLLKEK